MTPTDDPAGDPAKGPAGGGGRPYDAWWLRTQMVRVMVSVAFAGGMLLGAFVSALGLPPGFWAPLAVVCCGGIWLFLRTPKGRT